MARGHGSQEPRRQVQISPEELAALTGPSVAPPAAEEASPAATVLEAAAMPGPPAAAASEETAAATDVVWRGLVPAGLGEALHSPGPPPPGPAPAAGPPATAKPDLHPRLLAAALAPDPTPGAGSPLARGERRRLARARRNRRLMTAAIVLLAAAVGLAVWLEVGPLQP